MLTKQELGRLTGRQTNETKTIVLATRRWVEKTLLYNAAVEAGLKKDLEIMDQRDRFYEDLLILSYLEIQTKN